MQSFQKPRRWHHMRVRREHAGHVGPDLQAAGLQLAREISRRRIGTTATQQYRLTVAVARDEPLGDDDAALRGQFLLQPGIGVKVAAGREVTGRRVARTP